MLARWKVAVLKQRKRQNLPPVSSCARSPETTKFSRCESKTQINSSKHDQREEDDADSFCSSPSNGGSPRHNHKPVETCKEWRYRGALQRAIVEKNRIVQRVLVALKLAEASKDTYFNKKLCEYEGMIKQLLDIRDAVEHYTQSLLELSSAVRSFAGNASDMRSSEPDDAISFLFAAETTEEHGHQFVDQVHQHILRSIDDRVIDLQLVCELLHEHVDLQVDVDYAKRTLIVAQQRGDVNAIADKKKALHLTQLRHREATRHIAQLLRHHDHKQEVDLDNLVTEFASMTKHFFQCTATLLRAAESLSCHGLSNTHTGLRTPGRPNQPIVDLEPVEV